MSDKDIHISKFDLNSRERLINAENEMKYQRLEIDKLTKLSSDFDKQIDHIKGVLKSFQNFSVRSTKAVKNLEKRYDELNEFYMEAKETLEAMEEVKKELDDFLDHQKKITELEPPVNKTIMGKLKSLERWKWMVIGGATVGFWVLTFVIKGIGITKVLEIIGLG